MTDTRDRPRWFLWSCGLVLGVLLIAYGCAGPRPPAKHPPVKAPPPAYGNKIV